MKITKKMCIKICENTFKNMYYLILDQLKYKKC